MQLLPGLQNFMKSRNALTLSPIKINIYTIKKVKRHTIDFVYTYFIFKYRIKTTRYTIYSYKDCKHRKNTSKNRAEDGFIKITKNFKTYKFRANELPPKVINAISKHMDLCNNLVKQNEANLKDGNKDKERKELDKQKLTQFIEELDLTL